MPTLCTESGSLLPFLLIPLKRYRRVPTLRHPTFVVVPLVRNGFPVLGFSRVLGFYKDVLGLVRS